MNYISRKQRRESEFEKAVGAKPSVRSFLDQRQATSTQLQQQKTMQLHSAGNVIQRLKGMSDTAFIQKHGHKFEEQGWTMSDLKNDLKNCSSLTEDEYLGYRKIAKSNKKEKDEDKTYGGARLIGDSNALARAKFNSKTRAIKFSAWKKGREAQHMVPASIAKKNKILAGIIDHKRNAIMLPALWKAGIKKPVHRQPNHRDHKAYTKNVRAMVKAVASGLKTSSLTKVQWKKVMDALRIVNRLNAYKYIDNIPYSEYQKAWNSTNKVQI